MAPPSEDDLDACSGGASNARSVPSMDALSWVEALPAAAQRVLTDVLVRTLRDREK